MPTTTVDTINTRWKISTTSVPRSTKHIGKRARIVLVYLAPLVLVAIAVVVGRYPMIPFDDRARSLLLGVRAPRIVAALVIGASLGLTGVILQALFRNPLVDANILGVTSGAGFGAALALLLGLGVWAVRGSSLLFGLLAVALTIIGARRYLERSRLMLTLMGILVAAFFGALTALITYVADPLDTLPRITFWLLGSLSTVGWQANFYLIVVTMLALAVTMATRWRINVISLDEAEIVALGVRPRQARLLVLFVASILTAAAVSIGGVIGWVGLVTPHVGRALVGSDHRRLIPISISLGAGFLLALDTIARALVAAEIPIGVLTGIVGVPVFMTIVRRRGESW